MKHQITNTKLEYKDENILVNSINGKSQGFLSLINELINDYYIEDDSFYIDNENNQISELLNENDNSINDNIEENSN